MSISVRWTYTIFPIKIGSQKSPRSRRQRTTSLNQTSQKTAAESIIRTQHRTIYTAGRPPWYNTEGQKVEPFVIGKQFSFTLIFLFNRTDLSNKQCLILILMTMWFWTLLMQTNPYKL